MERHEATRALIVDTGLRLLGRSGIRKLTQTRVATEAGLKQGHLTYYFPTKGHLLSAIVLRFFTIEEEWANKILRSNDDGVSPLRAFPREAIAYIVDAERTTARLSSWVEALSTVEGRRRTRRLFFLQRRAVAAMLGTKSSDPQTEVVLSALRSLSLDWLFSKRTKGDLDKIRTKVDGLRNLLSLVK